MRKLKTVKGNCIVELNRNDMKKLGIYNKYVIMHVSEFNICTKLREVEFQSKTLKEAEDFLEK